MLMTTLLRGLAVGLLALYACLSMQAQAQLVRQAATSIRLPDQPPPETNGTLSYNTVRALPASITFTAPMATEYPPGETSQIYVIERGGRIWRVSGLGTANVTKNLFMDLGAHLNTAAARLVTNDENGLLAMAFHPQYNDNGYFYLYYSITSAGQLHQRLARFTSAARPGLFRLAPNASPATETPLLTLYDRAGNHNGGDLGFGNDGFLYISLGDEGGGGDQYNNARYINKNFWGQMLRLDVDNLATSLPASILSQPASTNFKQAAHANAYKVPANNPFIGRTSWHGQSISSSTVLKEIYATGLRNPFRFCFDSPTGRLFLGDVGQSLREEVNLITAGGDYGWSWREGNLAYTFAPAFNGSTNPPTGSAFAPVEPIYYYGRTSAPNGIAGSSVCAGVVYRGTRLPELQGAHLVADIYDGSIAAFNELNPGRWSGGFLTRRTGIVDFGINPSNGEPILCNLNDGILYELVATSAANAVHARLSQLGIFSDLATLAPAQGVVPYETNVSFWSDHAFKKRWFAMKNISQPIWSSVFIQPWTFPEGTVWVKHFDINRTRGNDSTRFRLETRILVKTRSSIYGLTYKWRGDQSDADLVAASGETSAIGAANPAQSWRFPSRGECLTCHRAAAGYALSFHSAQLNRSFAMSGTTPANQIDSLRSSGYVSGGLDSNTPLVAHDQSTASLEWRARSYLDVNCSQCHRPGGQAQGNWDARATTATALAGLINGSLVSQGNDPANRVVVPGDPARSMLLLRMQGAHGMTRMPNVGSLERDLEGEQMIADWITNYKSLKEWQEEHFGSADAPEAQPGHDADGDGYTNEQEYILGTLPTDAASRWAVLSCEPVNGQLEVRFPLPANSSAKVSRTSDFRFWYTVPIQEGGMNFNAADSVKTFRMSLGNRREFFKIEFKGP